MEKDIQKINNCGNCLFFSRHYVKLKNNYVPVNCGHCKNIDGNRVDRLTPFSICDSWQVKDKEQEDSL